MSTAEKMPDPSLVIEQTPGKKRWRVGTLSYTAGGLRMVFFWLLWGDFTLALRGRSVGPTFQLLLKQLHASDLVLAMLVVFIPQTIGMVLGPVISYRSDRHRGRWGRRLPYLLIPTPFVFLGMVGLAFSPKIGAWAHPFLSEMWEAVVHLVRALPAWVPAVHGMDQSVITVNGSILLTVAVCWTMYEICVIVSGSVFTGLINDVVPRGVLGRFFGLFRVISLADGIFFMLVLIKYAEKYYVEIFCGVGALFAISFIMMCLMVKEGEYPPPDTIAEGKPRNIVAAVKTYFRESFSHPYYRWLAASIALTIMGFVPINTFAIYYFKTFNMDMKVYGWFAAAQFALSLVQAYPIGWLADRFHPIRLVFIGIGLYAATMSLAFVLVTGPISFGVFLILTGTCAGFWSTAYSPMLPALLPRESFATAASAIGVCSSIGTMIVAPACGWFLDHIVHHQYRYIFLWSLVLDVLALGATFMVYRKFMEYGGPRGYVAPV